MMKKPPPYFGILPAPVKIASLALAQGASVELVFHAKKADIIRLLVLLKNCKFN
jgi:hypothetical protein